MSVSWKKNTDSDMSKLEDFKKAGVYTEQLNETKIPQDEHTLVFIMNENDWFTNSIRSLVKESVKHQPVYIVIQYKDKRLKYAAVGVHEFEKIDNHIRELIFKDNEPKETLEELKPTTDEKIDNLETDLTMISELEKEFGDKTLSEVRKILAKRYEHLCYEDLFPY